MPTHYTNQYAETINQLVLPNEYVSNRNGGECYEVILLGDIVAHILQRQDLGDSIIPMRMYNGININFLINSISEIMMDKPLHMLSVDQCKYIHDLLNVK